MKFWESLLVQVIAVVLASIVLIVFTALLAHVNNPKPDPICRNLAGKEVPCP